MSDDEQQEQTIAEDLVVTKYKMGGDIANRKWSDDFVRDIVELFVSGRCNVTAIRRTCL